MRKTEKLKRNSWLLAVLTMVLAAVLVLSTHVPALAEGGGVTILLHYHRPDGVYDDWDVWAWAEGQDGAAYALEEMDGERVATIPVKSGVTRMGFIVRQGGDSWSAKDFDADQFIELPDVQKGTVHIYVESGVEGYTREDGDDVVTGVLLSSVKYDFDTGAVLVTATGDMKEDPAKACVVNGPDGKIDIQEAKDEGNHVYALTVGELDLNSKYTLTYNETEYEIAMPNLYSTQSFEEEYTYTGDDLGAVWTKEATSFKVWAPTAESVSVKLYETGDAGAVPETAAASGFLETLAMTKDQNGTWTATKKGDLNGVYYTYEVTVAGETREACDPYARTTGVNGQRAMVLDLSSTNPEGWDQDKNPNASLPINDAVIYELHVRDLSMDPDSGIQNKGKYLAFTETGTETPGGNATGIDHIKELGATHVHLLPVYDFGSVDETKLDEPQFNWGYDPVNYNVPEGSYSTDPYHGEVRVKEMKQMIQSLHENGLSVVMDVVYNHVQSATDFCFNQIVPDYFSRVNENGVYSNGSGCGNDTASERSMVRKYIVDSILYWTNEYHMDGFRFDLVGLLDTQTINEIVESVHAVRPDVIFYGEGWSMTTDVTKEEVELATQQNARKTPGFAYFNDTIRDAIKGSVFDQGAGYVSGDLNKASSIAQSFMGKTTWSRNPAQLINYASCHDNNTLFDRIALSRSNASREDLIRMNNLAAAIYMTSQGVPFLQAGEEMLRTKVNEDGTFNENSYNASDQVNSLKWSTLDTEEYQNVFNYYKGLIAFRKAHHALRQNQEEGIGESISQTNGLPKGVLGFEIAGGANGDPAEGIYVIFNATEESQTIALPEGSWNVYIDGDTAGCQVLDTKSGSADVEPISAMVLVRGEAADVQEPSSIGEETTATTASESSSVNPILLLGGIAAVIAVVVIVVVVVRKKNGKKGEEESKKE